jgi:hypothetical protein
MRSERIRKFITSSPEYAFTFARSIKRDALDKGRQISIPKFVENAIFADKKTVRENPHFVVNYAKQVSGTRLPQKIEDWIREVGFYGGWNGYASYFGLDYRTGKPKQW